MIKFIREGDKLPNGFYIKSGLGYKASSYGWQSVNKTLLTGETVLQLDYVPVHPPVGVWMTFGFVLFKFHMGIRIRDYTDKKFIFYFEKLKCLSQRKL